PSLLLAATTETIPARSIKRSCSLSSISSRRRRNSARSGGVRSMVSSPWGRILLESRPGEIKENVDMPCVRSLPSGPESGTGGRSIEGLIGCLVIGLDAGFDLTEPRLAFGSGLARTPFACAGTPAARLRDRFWPVHYRVSDLWLAQSGPVERHPGLSCADWGPIRRRPPSDHR